MAEWIDFDRWAECARMERPGYVFEVANDDDQRMLTVCGSKVEVPSDWRSPPVRFRIVEAPPPRRSAPLPKAQKP